VVVAGVETWLARYPAKTKTDFILEACLEKLAREGIILDLEGNRPAVRQRKQPPPEAFQRVKVTASYDQRDEKEKIQILRQQAEEVRHHINAKLNATVNKEDKVAE